MATVRIRISVTEVLVVISFPVKASMLRPVIISRISQWTAVVTTSSTLVICRVFCTDFRIPYPELVLISWRASGLHNRNHVPSAGSESELHYLTIRGSRPPRELYSFYEKERGTWYPYL